MTNRMIVALGAALAFVGSSLADPPAPMAGLDRPIPAETTCPPPAATTADCGPLWVALDPLLSFFYGVRVPPLVTTSPVGTPRAQAGVFNQPTETIALASGRVNSDARAGIRIQGGYWFEPQRQCGFEAGFTHIESQSALFGASTEQSPILARPYINANTNAREAVLLSFPDAFTGAITISVHSGSFFQGYADLIENLWDEDGFRLDGMVGYRGYRYDEGVRIRQVITATNDPNLLTGTEVVANDDFSTQNEFHGFGLGLRGSIWFDEDFSLELLGKLAVGNLRRHVKISGNQRITVPGTEPEVREGGVFALSSNIGVQKFSEYAALPEAGFTLRYRVTEYALLRAGYNILFLEGVSRAVQQIDETLNPNLFPGSGLPTDGPQRPAPTTIREPMWIMNISLGLELMY